MACWLKDPSLFIEYYDSKIKQWRLHENFNNPLIDGQDYSYVKNITNYLDLVDHSFPWKESDFDAFKDFLHKYDIMVNCQGLVLSVTFPRQRENHYQPGSPSVRFRSLDVVDLSRFGLPAPSIPFREVQYLETRKSAPVESSPKEQTTSETNPGNADKDLEMSELRKSLKQEKEAKEALERQVKDLELKQENWRRSLEPWMSYSNVGSDWVTYEGLVINNDFRRLSGRAYTLAETVESSDLNEDDTTNIQPKLFYRALMDGLESMMELIVVQVEELTPHNEKAKFKPDVWFQFDNAGEFFAAREPTESEKQFKF